MATSLRHACVIPLCLLSACSILGLDGSSGAWVGVDPTIVQTLYYPDTRETVTKDRFIDHDEIECSNESPPTCVVTEFVRATIHNEGDREIWYARQCTGPLQHRAGEGWAFVVNPVACDGVPVPPIEIPPGEDYTIDVAVPDGASEEFRMVVALHDDDGPLPSWMRTSEPFELALD